MSDRTGRTELLLVLIVVIVGTKLQRRTRKLGAEGPADGKLMGPRALL
jgi:hypothetical protein